MVQSPTHRGLRRAKCRTSVAFTGVLAIAAASSSPALAQLAPSPEYVDATSSHMPQDPTVHALDAAFIDVDKDGDLDLVIACEWAPNRLYLNDGTGILTWQEGALGTEIHDSEHVRAADFDGDGNLDAVFVAEHDGVHQLFLGDGKGGFTDASDRLLARSQGNGLAVGDVNGDGLPDIVVGNTGEAGFHGPIVPAHNFLWLNDPDRPGHFIDATDTHLPPGNDQTEGVALADMDGDGDLDMLTASPTLTNRLLLNDGEGHFSDASDRLELKVPMETREVHVFDANGDDLPDILYFNLTSNNADWDKDPQARLLINDGSGHFRDETARLPEHTFSSWAGGIADFNHDGAQDIIVSAIQVPGFVPLQVRAWQNDGAGQFTDVTLSMVPSLTVGRSWSVVPGDLDGDGKDDLFIGGWGTQARLLLTNKPLYESLQTPLVELDAIIKPPEGQ